jgi:hypothetical protein
MFKNAKKGDEVYDLTKGKGTIVSVRYSEKYPILVQFSKEKSREYTIKGYYFEQDTRPSLYWNEVKFEIPPTPLPELEVDTCVLVWDNGPKNLKRHFSHFDKDGRIQCFTDGRTSWTTDGDVCAWKNWELADTTY